MIGGIIMAGLTPKDYEILDFILEEQHTKGYPPTVREISRAACKTGAVRTFRKGILQKPFYARYQL